MPLPISNHYAHCRGLHIEALNTVSQLERPAYRRVGIHRQQEIVNQEIEGLAFDLHAGNLYALHIHGGHAMRRSNPRRDAHRPLAIEQLRHQPAGR